jgi:MoxR-like ATPase
MPFDITGSEILAREGDGFQFLEGPVFTNILLADEINRATPRTQSALLEAMEERQVTAGTKTHSLPNPFFVAATQNPIELEGTYPLPEAQLDRFIFKLELSRPSAKTLQAILELDYGESSGPSFLDEDSVKGIQELVALMPLPNTATAQIAALISATHPEDNSAPEIVRKNVRWGASPRAGLAILAGAQSLALLRGRAHVSPEDLRDAAVPALRHRIALRYESVASGVGVSDVISEVLKNHSIQ